MTDEAPTRTYEIATASGDYRITIPETWKVTFGAVVPGKGSTTYGLRVWESETKQRLIFTDVRSFRDVSIPIQRRAVRKFGDDQWYSANRGKPDTVEEGWMDLDKVNPGFAPEDDDLPDTDYPLASKRGF